MSWFTAALRRWAGELGPKLPGPPGALGGGGLISSSSVWRVSRGVNSGGITRGSPRSTQAPLSLPAYLARSVESLTSSATTLQATVPGLPFASSVLPLHAWGYAASGLGHGARIRPL